MGLVVGLEVLGSMVGCVPVLLFPDFFEDFAVGLLVGLEVLGGAVTGSNVTLTLSADISEKKLVTLSRGKLQEVQFCPFRTTSS